MITDAVKRVINISSKETITRLEGAILMGLLNGIPSEELQNTRDKSKHYYNLIYGNLAEFCINYGPNKGLYKTKDILSYYNERYDKNITLLDLKDKEYVKQIINDSTQDVYINTNYEQISNIEDSESNNNYEQQINSYNELKIKYDEAKNDIEYYQKIYTEIKEKYDVLNTELEATRNAYDKISDKLQFVENKYKKLNAECTLKDLEIDSLSVKIKKIENLYLDETV